MRAFILIALLVMTGWLPVAGRGGSHAAEAMGQGPVVGLDAMDILLEAGQHRQLAGFDARDSVAVGVEDIGALSRDDQPTAGVQTTIQRVELDLGSAKVT